VAGKDRMEYSSEGMNQIQATPSGLITIIGTRHQEAKEKGAGLGL
jgi:hypothetical protein